MNKTALAKWGIATLLSLILLFNYTAAFSANKGFDFYAFYAAAKMYRAGLGSHLFDLRLQEEWQLKTTGEAGVTFNYPPAAVLLYYPFSFMSIQAAHAAWIVFSMILLAISAAVMHREIGALPDAQWTYLSLYLFVPVHILLLQGQVSALMLFIYVFAFAKLRTGNSLSSGLILAAGLLKFHLVLPVAALMLLRKKWRWCWGFGIGALLFAAVCIAVSGWGFIPEYRQALTFHLQGVKAAGYNPGVMINLHGLLYLLFRREPWIILEIVLGGLVFVITAIRVEGKGPVVVCAGLIMTLLISRHLNPHDVTLLVLPLVILIKNIAWRSVEGVLVLALGLPVLPALLLKLHLLPLLSVPLLALWWISLNTSDLKTENGDSLRPMEVAG